MVISQNTAAITTRVQGEEKKKKRRTNSLKDLSLQTEPGRSQPRLISYNKIFKNSLYRGLSSLIYTLIYGKETQKYICINPYILYLPCIY